METRNLIWQETWHDTTFHAASNGYNCVYFIEKDGTSLTCSKMVTIGLGGSRVYFKIEDENEITVDNFKALCQHDFERCVIDDFLVSEPSRECSSLLDDSD